MKDVKNRIHIVLEDWEDEAAALKRAQKQTKLTDEQFKTYQLHLYKDNTDRPYKVIEPFSG